MFALYGNYGLGATKKAKKKAKKKPEKKIPTQTAVPVTKVVVKKPVKESTLKKAIKTAAKKTAVKASIQISPSKSPKPRLVKRAEDKIKKIVDQTKPSIIPDIPGGQMPGTQDMKILEKYERQESTPVNKTPLLIAGAAVIGFLLLGRKK